MKRYQMRQRVVWMMVVTTVLQSFTPALQAATRPQDEDEVRIRVESKIRLENLNRRATVIDGKLATLEGRVGALKQGLDLFRANNTTIASAIKEVADGNEALEATLYELANTMVSIRDRQSSADAALIELTAGLENIAGVMEMTSAELAEVLKLNQCTAAELEQVNCLLCKANQILCTLPGDIRRAKVRAFIFGFLVGMGVSAAISGGAGGAAAIPKFW